MRRLAVALLAVLVLADAASAAAAGYRCRLDGSVRASCCCDEVEHVPDGDGAPAADDACCCDRENLPAQEPAATGRPDVEAAPALIAGCDVAGRPSHPTRWGATHLGAARAAPLFILLRSLRI